MHWNKDDLKNYIDKASALSLVCHTFGAGSLLVMPSNLEWLLNNTGGNVIPQWLDIVNTRFPAFKVYCQELFNRCLEFGKPSVISQICLTCKLVDCMRCYETITLVEPCPEIEPINKDAKVDVKGKRDSAINVSGSTPKE